MNCDHHHLDYLRPCRSCLLTRVEELETVLKLVQRWGADARSADSYEVFAEVTKVLDPVPEPSVTVVDCACIPCVCLGLGGGRCLGCGARTCLTHELALKSSSQTLPEAKSREDPE